MKTKKILSFLLAVVMMFSVSSVAFADENEEEYIEGSIGWYDITWRYFPDDCELIIHSNFSDTITDIGNDIVRENCEKIYLQGKITKIGDHAFENYKKLKYVNPHVSCMTQIGDYAFRGCISLETVYASKLEKIGREAFANCVNLKKVDMYNTQPVAEIGEGCFKNCINLESVSLPAGVTEIPSECFANCYSLTNPPARAVIKKDAFLNCFSLKKVYVNGILEPGAYNGCINIESVEYAPVYDGHEDEIEVDKKICENAFELLPKLKSYEINRYEERDIPGYIFPGTLFKSYSFGRGIYLGEKSVGYSYDDEFIAVKTEEYDLLNTVNRELLYAKYTGDTVREAELSAELESRYAVINEKYADLKNRGIIDENGKPVIIKVDGFVISGYKYSEAQEYAEKNGFEFHCLDYEFSKSGDYIGCGGNCRYIEDEKKLEVVIPEELYIMNNYPWDYYRDEIEEIEITFLADESFGVFRIPEHAFDGMQHVKSLSIISHVWNDDDCNFYVEDYAFGNMPELETIMLDGYSVGFLSDTAFAGCKNVKTVINKSKELVINLDEECSDTVMISCYNDSVQHQTCIDGGISHITIDRDKPCGRNSNNPVERIKSFLYDVIDSLRSFFEKLFKI